MKKYRRPLATKRLILFVALFAFFGQACHAREDSSKQKKAPEAAKTESRPVKNYDRYWNDVSRYLAGMKEESGSRVEEFALAPASKKQRTFFINNWEKIESSRLEPMRKWRDEELSSINRRVQTVFYPFGGPDFLHVTTFFPGARDYIHFGLEPPGSPPDIQGMTDSERENLLYLTRTSLNSVLRFSFFRTNDMRRDLIQSQMGAGPILMAFAARTGHRVLDVESVRIDSTGKEVPGTGPGIPGIRITIQKEGQKEEARIHYFSLDISDGAYSENAPLYTFVKSFGSDNLVSYAKGASYLMHRDNFSHIRNFVLDESFAYLQDDSGIPLHFFREDRWNLIFYGSFQGPISLFRARDQADLRRAYRSKEVRPLPFGIGYVYRKGQSNLMLAVKKGTDRPEIPAPSPDSSGE